MRLRKKTKNETDSYFKMKELMKHMLYSLEQSYLVIKREKTKRLNALYLELEFE
jgi:dsDNA-binding SOS-regulon protein